VQDAPVVLQELEEWDEAVAEKQAELGYPDVPFNELTGKARKNVEEALEEEGVYEPKVPWQVEAYLEWAEQQPIGADTSIDAFLRANQRDYERNSYSRFQELYGAEEPRSTSDGTVWSAILDYLNEHDYDRYPD
jgi:hypothetical protein